MEMTTFDANIEPVTAGCYAILTRGHLIGHEVKVLRAIDDDVYEGRALDPEMLANVNIQCGLPKGRKAWLLDVGLPHSVIVDGVRRHLFIPIAPEEWLMRIDGLRESDQELLDRDDIIRLLGGKK